jgi:hypothetical protein
MEMLSNVRIVERSEKFAQFSEHIKQERSKFDEGLSNVQKILEHRQRFDENCCLFVKCFYWLTAKCSDKTG